MIRSCYRHKIALIHIKLNEYWCPKCEHEWELMKNVELARLNQKRNGNSQRKVLLSEGFTVD